MLSSTDDKINEAIWIDSACIISDPLHELNRELVLYQRSSDLLAWTDRYRSSDWPFTARKLAHLILFNRDLRLWKTAVISQIHGWSFGFQVTLWRHVVGLHTDLIKQNTAAHHTRFPLTLSKTSRHTEAASWMLTSVGLCVCVCVCVCVCCATHRLY